MKYIHGLFSFLILSGILNAQLIVGPDADSSKEHEKAILSFTSENMGVILPIIKDASTENNHQKGGVIFTSRSGRQVKMWTEADDLGMAKYVALTPGLPTSVILPSDNLTTSMGKGVLIANPLVNDTPMGVLELSHQEKTFILPLLGTVEFPPFKYVKHPYIGTIGFSEIENGLFPTTKPPKSFLWVYGGGTPQTGGGQWHLWSAGVEMAPIIVDDDYFNQLP